MSTIRIEDRSRTKVRGNGWRCHAQFLGRANYPPDQELATFLPLERIARLPTAEGTAPAFGHRGSTQGGFACVLVACRVETVERGEKLVGLGVRVMTPTWNDAMRAWVTKELLPVIERCVEQVAEQELPPAMGSEIEIAAYYPRDFEQTIEEFARSLGILVGIRFEYLAGFRRAAARETARRARQKRLSSPEPPVWHVRAWRAVASLPSRVLDMFLPPLPVDEHVGATSVPDDLWTEKSEVVMRVFFDKAHQAAGRFLRQATIHDADVFAYLQRKEGVMAGESASMVADHARMLDVTRVDEGFGPSRSMVFELVDERAYEVARRHVDAPDKKQ